MLLRSHSARFRGFLQFAVTLTLALLIQIASAHASPFLHMLEPNNYARLKSQGGSLFVINSLDLSKHFANLDEVNSNIFIHNREKQDTQPLRPPPMLPVAWDLGISHGLFFFDVPAEDIFFTDQLLSGRIGIKANLPYHLQLNAQLNIDSLPEENYRHGRITFQFAKVFSFPPKIQDSEEDADSEDEIDAPDALEAVSDYYQKQRAQDMKDLEKERNRTLAQVAIQEGQESDADEEEQRDAKKIKLDALNLTQIFPQIRAGILLTFDTHVIYSKRFLRRLTLPRLAQDTVLTSAAHGLEISYSPNAQISWAALINHTYYFSTVAPLIQGFEANNSLQANAVSLGPDHFLAFSSLSAGGQFQWTRSNLSQLQLEILYSTFATDRTESCIWIHPQYSWVLSPQWQLETGGSLAVPQTTFTASIEASLRYTF